MEPRQDLDVAKFMAGCPKATDIKAPVPMLIEMDLHKATKMELYERIRKALAQGTAVLVHGWEAGDEMTLCVEDIAMHRPPIDQDVIWQGM